MAPVLAWLALAALTFGMLSLPTRIIHAIREARAAARMGRDEEPSDDVIDDIREKRGWKRDACRRMLDVVGKGPADLYKLSQPCRLGECDAFL